MGSIESVIQTALPQLDTEKLEIVVDELVSKLMRKTLDICSHPFSAEKFFIPSEVVRISV